MASAAAAKMAALHAAATGLRPCPAISPVANRWGILYTTPCEFKVLSMRDILQDFKFMPDGATNLVDALCRFIKEGITFGRITGGEKLPTIGEICKATGLTFAQARRVTDGMPGEGGVRQFQAARRNRRSVAQRERVAGTRPVHLARHRHGPIPPEPGDRHAEPPADGVRVCVFGGHVLP